METANAKVIRIYLGDLYLVPLLLLNKANENKFSLNLQ